MLIWQQDRITQIVSALKEYEPERIILFGSQARGNADQYSDLDIVIIKETDERFLDRLKTIYELVQPRFAMDVLVYTPQEFAEMQERGNPFVEMVLREGIVVYERPGS
jgi:predicted nucleotidyltransferase